MIDQWCKNDDGSVCETRKNMYLTAYDRYVEGVKKGEINQYTSNHPYTRKQVDDIIKEVINA